MGLFKPAWKSKNTQKALRAVEKLSDQRKLFLAAQWHQQTTNEQVYNAAIATLSTPVFLLDLTKSAVQKKPLFVTFRRLLEVAEKDCDYASASLAFCFIVQNKRTENIQNIAQIFTKSARKHPESIRAFWPSISQALNSMHADKRPTHTDKTQYSHYHYSDCHDDKGIHTDFGNKLHSDRCTGEESLRMFEAFISDVE